MKTFTDAPGIDLDFPQINRVFHNGTIYVIETEADYDALPQEVNDLINPIPVEGGDV